MLKNVTNGKLPVREEALSPKSRATIVEYVRSQMHEWLRHVLQYHDQEMPFPQIARLTKRDLTTVHHDFLTASAQICVALDASWACDFRQAVLREEEPTLPLAIFTLNDLEVKAANALSNAEKAAILRSKHTVASRIAREVGVTQRAVRGFFKHERGQWSILSNEKIVEAYHRTDGNITKAAELLNVKRPRVSVRLRALGLVSRQKRGKRWALGRRR